MPANPNNMPKKDWDALTIPAILRRSASTGAVSVARARMSPSDGEEAPAKKPGKLGAKAAPVAKAAPAKAAPKAVAKPAPAPKSETAEGDKVGRASPHAGKKITGLVKLADCGLRPSSGRYAMLAAALKAKKADDLLGTVVTDGTEKEHTIGSANLDGMVKRGHISIG